MRYLWFTVLVFLMGGCAYKLPRISPTKEDHLRLAIRGMDRTVNKKDAARLAHEAVMYSRLLAARYNVQTSPWVHNFLVNAGLKKRGLCYQWADDLWIHLSAMHLKSIRLLPVGANIGDYWREHNAIAVLPRHHHIPLGRAIVLDAWRHSGNLYFSTVARDEKYKWQIRQERIKTLIALKH